LWRLRCEARIPEDLLPRIRCKDSFGDYEEDEISLKKFVLSNELFPTTRYMRWRKEADHIALFLSETCNRVRSLFDNFIAEMRYVGPIRRFSEWEGTVDPNPMSAQFGATAEMIDPTDITNFALAAVNRFLSGPGFTMTPYELRLVSRHAKKSNLRGPAVRVPLLVDLRNKLEVLPSEVGVGLSHLLPVVTSVLANIGTTILIEQPELHVHPALQSEIADVLIEGALGDNGNTVIAETHSEHLLLRILRRIRETTNRSAGYPDHLPWIGPGDVAIYYAQPGVEGTTFHPIKISIQGEFETEWPQGFFPKRFNELFS